MMMFSFKSGINMCRTINHNVRIHHGLLTNPATTGPCTFLVGWNDSVSSPPSPPSSNDLTVEGGTDSLILEGGADNLVPEGDQ